MSTTPQVRTDVDALADGLLGGHRATLAKAITLVESTRPEHQETAQELLLRVSGHGTRSRRVGISGVPGVGKSTFIDTLGSKLTGEGHRVAVLAVDPSSSRSGGSILGDKTRMTRLAYDERAFIRPSPTAGNLGGVARATREAIVLVEAAGFDTVLVETVGVGQSETAVAAMVDSFLVLMLARSGDSLQGIKKGILELADVLAVNKADGEGVLPAQRTARELADALHLLRPTTAGWSPPVLTCSAVDESGIDELWAQVEAHLALLEASGQLATRRRDQQIAWMWATVEDRLLGDLRRNPDVRALVPGLTEDVGAGDATPTSAATALIEAYLGRLRTS
jgi:LAO/AO transport system kinase